MSDSGSFLQFSDFRPIAGFTFSALTAAVTDHFHSTGLAASPQIRLIQLILPKRIAPVIGKPEFNLLTLEAQARTKSLLALKTIAFQFVKLSVLNKASSGPAEDKGDIVFYAFIAERFYPFIMAGPGTVIVFSVTKDLPDVVQGRSPLFRQPTEAVLLLRRCRRRSRWNGLRSDEDSRLRCSSGRRKRRFRCHWSSARTGI